MEPGQEATQATPRASNRDSAAHEQLARQQYQRALDDFRQARQQWVPQPSAAWQMAQLQQQQQQQQQPLLHLPVPEQTMQEYAMAQAFPGMGAGATSAPGTPAVRQRAVLQGATPVAVRQRAVLQGATPVATAIHGTPGRSVGYSRGLDQPYLGGIGVQGIQFVQGLQDGGVGLERVPQVQAEYNAAALNPEYFQDQVFLQDSQPRSRAVSLDRARTVGTTPQHRRNVSYDPAAAASGAWNLLDASGNVGLGAVGDQGLAPDGSGVEYEVPLRREYEAPLRFAAASPHHGHSLSFDSSLSKLASGDVAGGSQSQQDQGLQLDTTLTGMETYNKTMDLASIDTDKITSGFNDWPDYFPTKSLLFSVPEDRRDDLFWELLHLATKTNNRTTDKPQMLHDQGQKARVNAEKHHKKLLKMRQAAEQERHHDMEILKVRQARSEDEFSRALNTVLAQFKANQKTVRDGVESVHDRKLEVIEIQIERSLQAIAMGTKTDGIGQFACDYVNQGNRTSPFGPSTPEFYQVVLLNFALEKEAEKFDLSATEYLWSLDPKDLREEFLGLDRRTVVGDLTHPLRCNVLQFLASHRYHESPLVKRWLALAHVARIIDIDNFPYIAWKGITEKSSSETLDFWLKLVDEYSHSGGLRVVYKMDPKLPHYLYVCDKNAGTRLQETVRMHSLNELQNKPLQQLRKIRRVGNIVDNEDLVSALSDPTAPIVNDGAEQLASGIPNSINLERSTNGSGHDAPGSALEHQSVATGQDSFGGVASLENMIPGSYHGGAATGAALEERSVATGKDSFGGVAQSANMIPGGQGAAAGSLLEQRSVATGKDSFGGVSQSADMIPGGQGAAAGSVLEQRSVATGKANHSANLIPAGHQGGVVNAAAGLEVSSGASVRSAQPAKPSSPGGASLDSFGSSLPPDPVFASKPNSGRYALSDVESEHGMSAQQGLRQFNAEVSGSAEAAAGNPVNALNSLVGDVDTVDTNDL